MDEHRRPDSRRLAHVALAAALLSAACATTPAESRESADEAAAASPDTVSFVAHGDSFYVVIVADTTRLYRIQAGDTSYVSRGYVTGRADGAGAPGARPDSALPEPDEGRPAAVVVPLAIPDVRKPEPRDTIAPLRDAPEPVPSDTTRTARMSPTSTSFE